MFTRVISDKSQNGYLGELHSKYHRFFHRYGVGTPIYCFWAVDPPPDPLCGQVWINFEDGREFLITEVGSANYWAEGRSHLYDGEYGQWPPNKCVLVDGPYSPWFPEECLEKTDV